MRRGEIWTVAGAKDYSGKPRPSVILQDEAFTTGSITVCGFTSDETAPELLRITVKPTPENGLYVESNIMVDKVTTIPRSKLGRRIGVLEPADMTALGRAVMLFLGLVSAREG